jgi:hypothetical protein
MNTQNKELNEEPNKYLNEMKVMRWGNTYDKQIEYELYEEEREMFNLSSNRMNSCWITHNKLFRNEDEEEKEMFNFNLNYR